MLDNKRDLKSVTPPQFRPEPPPPPHPPLTAIHSLFDHCTLPLPAVHPLTCVHLLMSGSGCGDDGVEVGPVHDGPTAAALRRKAAARSGRPVG